MNLLRAPEPLTSDEKAYLRPFLKEHFEFYRRLAGLENCSSGNRKLFALVSGLWDKLQ